MIEERWFSYPIWYDMVEYEHHEELLKYCLLRKAYDDGNIKSNKGGWQSSDLFPDTDEVMNKFSVFLEKKLDELGVQLDKKIILSNMWININGYNTFNHSHTHPHSKISGVFYVKSEENQGSILFEHPIKNINEFVYEDSLKIDNEVSYKPKTGKLIFFPSLLAHSVTPNLTNIDRISISFNSFFVKR